MALTQYYGLKDSAGNIIAKGWTSLPTLNLYICNINHGQWYECYANSTYQIRKASTLYSSGIGGPAYGNIPKTGEQITFLENGSNTTYYRVSSNISGYSTSLTANVAIGTIVYQFDKNDPYTICRYYKFTVSANTKSVGNTQVGNIAFYNGSTLIAGSVSTSSYGSTTISATVTSESSSVSLKLVAKACTSKLSNWHNKYFFNGIQKDTLAITDSTISFTKDTATYTFNADANSTSFVVNYGAKYALTITKGSGISTLSVSYSRHHSTGNYVSTSTSPTSLTNSGTLYIENGSNLSVSATCASGYVFSTKDGFISQTSGISSLYGANASTLKGTIPTITKAASFKVTASTYTITASIANKPEWGSVYIDTEGTTEKTLVEGQTYSLRFKSSRANYEAPTVDYWSINGTKITGSTYTANTLSGNVTATCTLKQNAWPVSVSATGNGTAKIAGRYNKESGATLTNTGYLRADGSDYIKITLTPQVHYGEVVSSRVISNLTEYAEGGALAYSLAKSGNASASFTFALAECVVKTANPNSNVCDVTPAAEALRFDSETPLTIYCQIKEAHILDWRVDYFEAGGAQYAAEKGGDGQFYYIVYPSVVGGKAELTFTPHLVSTLNTLTVNKSGDTSFATVNVSIDGVEESVTESSWSAKVREYRPVICRAIPKFGGKISKITSTNVDSPEITESQISFAMPTKDAAVNFEIAEKDKVTLSLAVANATNPDVTVGKISLTCDASASFKEEVTTLEPQAFQVYKDTIYTLTADDSDTFYTFSGWYLNNVFKSSDLSIEINLSDLSSAYVARYVLRRAGEITISYGLKSGDNVLPTELPADSQPFGLAITTPPDQTNPDRWVVGNNRYVDFKVLDDGISVEDDITYVWTPVRVEVMANNNTDNWHTIWTYDANNPDSRVGRFVMRDEMLVRLVFTKVQAEGYARVQALFMDGDNGEHGALSIYATGMLSYYSIGGVAEASCYVGRKAVLSAAVKPGYAFNGWWRKNGDKFEPVDSDSAILTIDSVSSSGVTYYADFSRTTSNVNAWNDGEGNKEFSWRSKVYVGTQFFGMRNVRVYSDRYPVKLVLMTATSPNGCFDDSVRKVEVMIQNQNPRLLPMMRLEKYFAFKVIGSSRINHVALGTSMEGLK